MKSLLHTLLLVATASTFGLSQNQESISWPEGKQAAISLTFDDGRGSQVTGGTALLDEFGIKATFYVMPSAVEQKLEGWEESRRQRP